MFTWNRRQYKRDRQNGAENSTHNFLSFFFSLPTRTLQHAPTPPVNGCALAGRTGNYLGKGREHQRRRLYLVRAPPDGVTTACWGCWGWYYLSVKIVLTERLAYVGGVWTRPESSARLENGFCYQPDYHAMEACEMVPRPGRGISAIKGEKGVRERTHVCVGVGVILCRRAALLTWCNLGQLSRPFFSRCRC